MDELTNLITNMGFPIAITVYLLVRFDGLINNMVKSQEKMCNTLDRLYSRITNNGGA